MLTNCMTSALSLESCLVSQAELLESFHSMVKRELVLKFVEKKTVEFYRTFDSEINQIKKLFEGLKKSSPRSPILPKYAGSARYALNLQRRLEATHKVIASVRYTLPEVAEAEEVLSNFTVTLNSIEQFIHNCHQEWHPTIENGLEKELHLNLLIVDKSADSRGFLSANFNPELLSMTQEVHYWERMRMPIPYVAMDINAQRDKYRVLRGNVLSIVRDYNKILGALDKEERRLFHDRIRSLDRKIMPGVSKLTWVTDKVALDFYYKESQRACRDCDSEVTLFKAAHQR